MKTHHKLYSTTTMFKVYLAFKKKKKKGRSKAAVLAVGHKRTARGEGGLREEGAEGGRGSMFVFCREAAVSPRSNLLIRKET